MRYRLGRTITEPGIAERWQEYEAQYRAQMRLDSFWMATLHDVVVEPKLLMALVDGYFIQELIRPATDLPKLFPGISLHDIKRIAGSRDEKYATTIGFAPSHTVDEAFLLGSGLYKNYYNWTVRFASQLRMFESFPRDVKLLTPSLKPHIRGSLALHRIRRGRVVPVTKPVLVRTLHLCSPPLVGRYKLSPQLALGFRKLRPLKDDGIARATRLFIPRVNVKLRRVVNEPEVIDVLSGLGFVTMDCAQHSIEQQARAFHGADIIVGTHGAGLANIVYAKRGTTVVEIVPEGYDQGVTSYRSLADHFRLRYVPLFAQEVAPHKNGNRCNSDVRINVRELKRTVLRLIAAKGDQS